MYYTLTVKITTDVYESLGEFYTFQQAMTHAKMVANEGYLDTFCITDNNTYETTFFTLNPS